MSSVFPKSMGWMGVGIMMMGCGSGQQATSVQNPETGQTASVPPSTLPTPPSNSKSFGEDLEFLKKHGEVQVLEAPGGGRVVVSAKYQGRVMTSAVSPDSASLGWLNRKFIEEGKTGTQFDNYGGEDRFWLGPEGGQFGLYFPPGAPFDISVWQTPNAFQVGTWDITEQDKSHVVFVRKLGVTNYSGAKFELEVRREVRLLAPQQVESKLGSPVPSSVASVAFETDNRLTNTGSTAWTEDKGLLSIWILAMFVPTPDTYAIIPFEKNAEGPVVNDKYFGKVPEARLRLEDGYLVFTCDTQHRSKIGLGPHRAKSVAGSYSESSRLLTIVQYDKPQGATRYVNSMWEMQKEPYGGDVVNSYNDGPTAPGKPPLGGFYELETSSPAAALAPGQSLAHVHRTYHFVGDRPGLDGISLKVLGVEASKAVAKK